MNKFTHTLVAAALRQATPCQQWQAGPKLGDQIKSFQDKRKTSVEAMEALLASTGEEGRTFTAEEQKVWDGHEAVVKEVDGHLARLYSLEKSQAADVASTARAAGTEDGSTGTDLTTGMPDSGRRSATIKAKPKVKGAFFAKYAHCLFKAGGNQMNAVLYAQHELGDKDLAIMIKTAQNPATTFTPGWAKELIDEETADFIEMLRPMSVYANFPAATTFNFDSTALIRIPRQIQGIPGGWVKEGMPIPVGQGAFDSMTLQPYKLGIITVATQEVLMRSTPSLEQILRDSMLRDTSIVLDRRLLSNHPGVAGESPAGLFHTSKAPPPITGSATGTAVDDMLADVAALVNAHALANSPLQTPVWVMHPTVHAKLMASRNAVGTFYFRDELSTGKLGGYAVVVTAAMDVSGNGGGTSAIDDLALIDGSQVIKGVGMSPQISMSDSASVHMESAPAVDIGGATTPVRSLWQTQSVGLRLVYEADFNVRHKESVQWIDHITW